MISPIQPLSACAGPAVQNSHATSLSAPSLPAHPVYRNSFRQIRYRKFFRHARPSRRSEARRRQRAPRAIIDGETKSRLLAAYGRLLAAEWASAAPNRRTAGGSVGMTLPAAQVMCLTKSSGRAARSKPVSRRRAVRSATAPAACSDRRLAAGNGRSPAFRPRSCARPMSRDMGRRAPSRVRPPPRSASR